MEANFFYIKNILQLKSENVLHNYVELNLFDYFCYISQKNTDWKIIDFLLII